MCFTAEKYFEMPTLNKFDDYDACMDVYKDKAKYCYVKSVIRPDENSRIYNDIREFSKRKKQHFRHDKLTRGICINKCEKLIRYMGADANSLYQPEYNNIAEKVKEQVLSLFLKFTDRLTLCIILIYIFCS